MGSAPFFRDFSCMFHLSDCKVFLVATSNPNKNIRLLFTKGL